MNDRNLKKEVQNLIGEVEKTHRYSMSRIYGLYNEVFGKDETPQSCASCLIRKVRELGNWLEEENLKETAQVPEQTARQKSSPKTPKNRLKKQQ